MKTTSVKKALAASALLAITAASSMAGILTYLQPFTLSSTPLSFTGVDAISHDFNKFNIPGATLLSVDFVVDASISSTVGFTGTESLKTTYTVSSGADIQLFDSTGTIVLTETAPKTSVDHKVNAGVHSYSISASGSGDATYNASGVQTAYVGNGFPDATIDISKYIGAGTFSVKLDGQIWGGVVGGAFTDSSNTGSASGQVQVVYTYEVPDITPTPEPGQIAASCLVLLGMGGFAARRRLARK